MTPGPRITDYSAYYSTEYPYEWTIPIHLLRGKEILENLPGFLRDKHPPSFFFLDPVFLRGRPFDYWRGREEGGGEGGCGWLSLLKTFFPLKHLEVSLFPPTFNGVSFSYPAVHAMTNFFFSADIFPSISFCRIFFFLKSPIPPPLSKGIWSSDSHTLPKGNAWSNPNRKLIWVQWKQLSPSPWVAMGTKADGD